MISFRYHLVSIVAVFLALALGVLVGTTVVNQGVINDLTNRTNSASKRAADLRKQVGDLQTQINRLNSFSSIVEPLLVDNQLNGTAVVMVTQEGVDASEVDGVRKVLGDAGAN
ncbi:MAG TPA: copper transporter, partial [Actinomycetota bacterium]